MDEIIHLLGQLGLGAAGRDIADLVMDLTGETLTLQQFQQEIRNILAVHGAEHCADAVVSALVETGFAGVSSLTTDGTADAAGSPGCSSISDSDFLSKHEGVITAAPRAREEFHSTAHGWLDIDGGIYVDVRQHGAESDRES